MVCPTRVVLFMSLCISPCNANREAVLAMGMSSEDSSVTIWGGADVKIYDHGFGMAGPFPSMVALIFKAKTESNPDPWFFCGGTLYKRKYILTAAHCTDTDPSEYELYAYLNPYINPRIAHSLADTFGSGFKDTLQALEDGSEELMQSLEASVADENARTQISYLKKFQEGIKRGLNKRLALKDTAPGASIFGLRHTNSGHDKFFGTMTHDVAVIELSDPPYPEDSEWWKILNVELPPSPPEVEEQSVEAMAYGNGITRPEKAVCGFGRLPRTNCVLQEKKMEIFGTDTCRNYMLHFTWSLLTANLQNFADEDLLVRVERHPEVQAGKKTAAQVVKEMRDMLSNFDTQLTHSQQSDAEAVLVRGFLHVDGTKQPELTKLWHASESELAGFKAGTQLCLMSSGRTGNVQTGDSGGPLIADDGKTLLGIAGWGVAAAGNANLMALPDGTHLRMPAFYASTAYFRAGIDAVVSCLSDGNGDCELSSV